MSQTNRNKMEDVNGTIISCINYDSNDLNSCGWEEVYVTGRIPSPRHAHSCAVMGDSMYMFGGYANVGIHLDDFYRFDFETSKWHRFVKNKKCYPKPRNSHTLVAYNECIYLFGGTGSTPQETLVYNELYRYNTKTQEWTLLSSAGVEGRWGHSAVVYKDKMIVFGGMGEGTVMYSSTVAFDFIAETWERLSIVEGPLNPKPVRRQLHTASIVKDKMYIVGGYDGIAIQNNMFELDLATLTWRGIGGQHSLFRCAASVTHNDCIYIFGGRGNRSMNNNLYKFDTNTLQWSTMPTDSLPSTRQFISGGLYNDAFYVFGGQGDYNENDMIKYNLNVSSKGKDIAAASPFATLFNNPLLSDIKFNVQGTVTYAHKCILAARNERFRAMITNEWEESRKEEIEIHDCTPEIFSIMIKYLYTNTLHFEHSINILELLRIADLYLVTDLKEQCSKIISKYLAKHPTLCLEDIYLSILNNKLF
ncbi:hypothetical protein CYY_010019 [Polysphondylium violaceum]|uniref:BTB domain-containing protein n=1 Tax=Polysphondylium violaceum TaxID=133409 RepID=A0A8J4UVH1_9MYCE|nr:hypothetical protein CYY_010019 [Polysphondylium violaceum]